MERDQGVDEAAARRGPRPGRQARSPSTSCIAAQRTADAAEEDAAAAIEVAAYFLNVAEYAVIDAALARMAADDLAEAAPTTVGATS